MKARILFAVMALGMATPSYAQTPTGQAPGSKSSCEILAQFEPWIIRKQFEAVVGEFLGKKVERWTIEDLNSVVTAAAGCDKFMSDRKIVRSSSWAAQMDAAAKVIIPVSMAIKKADDDMGSNLQASPWIPDCMKLLDWRRSRKSWKNNSAEIFGRDFLDMPRPDLEMSKQRAISCKEANNLIGKARHAGDEVGSMISDDISFAVDRSIEALAEETGDKVLNAFEDGKRIPLSYTTQKARMMLGIVNRAIKVGRSMTPDESTDLIVWADSAIKSGNDADVAYAKLVKEFVAKQMFRRED